MLPDKTIKPPRRDSRRWGQGAVFLCAVLWSTSGLFIKLTPWHPVVLAGVRSGIAALFLGGLRLLRPRRGSCPVRLPLILAGGAAYAATMLCFVAANKLTSSANAILLQYSAPVWAALLGWLFAGEKPRWEHWAALVMVTGGLLLFFSGGLSGGSALGNGLAVFSGVCFGANSVFMRLLKDGDPGDSMFAAHIICALCSLPFLFLFPPSWEAASWGAVLFMGLFQIGLASLLFAYGIKRVSAVQAMLTAIIEPVLNPLWVLLVTGERPSLQAVLGGGIIVGAVLFSSLSGSAWRRRS